MMAGTPSWRASTQSWIDRAARRVARVPRAAPPRSVSHEPRVSRGALLSRGARRSVALAPELPRVHEPTLEQEPVSRRAALGTVVATTAIAAPFVGRHHKARAATYTECAAGCVAAYSVAAEKAAMRCANNIYERLGGWRLLIPLTIQAGGTATCAALTLAESATATEQCTKTCAQSCSGGASKACDPPAHVAVGGLTPPPVVLQYQGEPTGCGCVGSDTCCGCGIPFEEGGAGMCCIYIDCRCCG
jgi:hypothetical protein